MTLRKAFVAIGAVAVLALATACSSTSAAQTTSPSSGGGAHGGPTAVITTPKPTPRVTTPSSAPSTPRTSGTIVDMTTASNGPSVCNVGEQRDQRNACAPCPDFEGCFTSPQEMQYFYNQIIKEVQDYSKATYVKMPDVANWYYVPTGVTGPEKCVDEKRLPAQYSDQSYEYCPSDENVYVGELKLWKYYSLHGDAAPAIAIAHEWGHHVQQEAGIFDYKAKTPEEERLRTIESEKQADCIAGSWLGWEISRGIVNKDDLADIDSIIADIASLATNPNRRHGTLEERTQSFILGMNNGINACVEFFPQTPIFVPAAG